MFPYIYLNYSEVVNDKIDDLEYVATYCPQTKSGICFNKNIGDKSLNLFASGFLFKDNLVLTSQEENVFWSQMLLTGIKGNQKFMDINDLFSIETTWKTIKEYFPEAQWMNEYSEFQPKRQERLKTRYDGAYDSKNKIL